MNTNAVRIVRDKLGNVVVRDQVQPGDSVQISLAMMDGQRSPHRGGVHTVAMRVLGDAYIAADFAGLSDEATRHAVVRRKLGDAATGRSAAFLDAAWATLAGVPGETATSVSPAAPHGLTDAQLAVAARGIEAALADNTKRGGHVADGRRRFQAQDRAVVATAHDEMCRAISDGWKTPEQRARDAGQRADDAANPGDRRMAALRDRDLALKASYRACWGMS